MKKLVLAVVAAAVVAAVTGCTATRSPAPARKKATSGMPSAILLQLEQPRYPGEGIQGSRVVRVLRVGLDGTVRSLEMTPVLGTDIRPSADGKRILYVTQDLKKRTLREYDVSTGKNTPLLTGTLVSWGWDGRVPIALTGNLRPVSVSPDYAPPGTRALVLSILDPDRSRSVTFVPDPVPAYSHAIGADASAWYFAGDNGVARVDRATGRSSVVGTFSPGVYGNAWYEVPMPEKRQHLALTSAIRPETFANAGVPLVTSVVGTTAVTVEVRNASDWRVLRRLSVNPPGFVGLPGVLSPDLTHWLVPAERGPAPGRLFHSLFVSTDVWEATGVAPIRVATYAPGEGGRPLAYLDKAYDFAYLARSRPVSPRQPSMDPDYEVRVYERKTGRSRTVAPVDGIRGRMLLSWNPRVIGFEY